jgi:hypothetical protein
VGRGEKNPSRISQRLVMAISEDLIQELLKREIRANQEMESLLDELLRGGSRPDRLNALKRVENSVQEEENGCLLSALDYSRQMQQVLAEEEFRWLELANSRSASRTRRRERTLLYRRLKELFDLEVSLARKQKRAAMALANDWSGLRQYIREGVAILRYRAMLTLAGWMFAAAIPGACDVCDAAVFGIVRTIYLPVAA